MLECKERKWTAVEMERNGLWNLTKWNGLKEMKITENYEGPIGRREIKWFGFKVKKINWTVMECEIDVIYIKCSMNGEV